MPDIGIFCPFSGKRVRFQWRDESREGKRRMLERKHERLLPTRQFAKRIAGFAGAAILLIVLALGIGIAGYHWIAGFSLIDALLNAAMILGGMGPVGELQGVAAKLFASAYALFSGLVFIAVAGMLFTPILHRILHLFHVDEPNQ
jgi:hypothetical protein